MHRLVMDQINICAVIWLLKEKYYRECLYWKAVPSSWTSSTVEINGDMVQCLFCLSSTAGLRRSFRLSRKEKENSPTEAKQAEQADAAELLTYEEVTKYQQQPGEQQRLIVLIGKRWNWSRVSPSSFPFCLHSKSFLFFIIIIILLSSFKWQKKNKNKNPHQDRPHGWNG